MTTMHRSTYGLDSGGRCEVTTETGPTTHHDIPAVMVEAAVCARDVHLTSVAASSRDIPNVRSSDRDAWLWECDCGAEGLVADDEEAILAAMNHAMTATVAAALSTCHIRPEWRAKITYSHGRPGHTGWVSSHEEAERDGRIHAKHVSGAQSVTIERRLVIECPPEPAEEAK